MIGCYDKDAFFIDSGIASYIMAAAVLKAAQELNRKVPDDLQVIGVDDSIICQIFHEFVTVQGTVILDFDDILVIYVI